MREVHAVDGCEQVEGEEDRGDDRENLHDTSHTIVDLSVVQLDQAVALFLQLFDVL